MKKNVKDRFKLNLNRIVVCCLLGICGNISNAYAQFPEDNAFAIARIKWPADLLGRITRADWDHDYPSAERSLMHQLSRVTAIDTTSDVEVVTLTDDRLFNFPFAYMCEVQNCTLSEEEAEGLREYLTRGGFVMIDDSWTQGGLDRFARELKKVFPEKQLVPIKPDHPIFKIFYQFDSIPRIKTGRQTSGIPVCYGIIDEYDRVMLFLNWNNDVFEPIEFASRAWSGNEAPTSYKLSINFILYAMTH